MSRFTAGSFFVPNRRKKMWAKPPVFQKGSGIKIFFCSRGVTICQSFLPHSTVIIRKRSHVFQKCSVNEKILDNKLSRFCWFFLSHIAEKHHGWTLLCFRNVLESKNTWIIAVSRFCWTFLSHSTEKFRRGTLVFQKCSGIEKTLDKRYHDFVQIFCLTVPIFCGEPFNDF